MYIEERKSKSGRISYRAIETYVDRLTGKRRRVSVTMDKKTNATMKWATAELQRKIDEAQETKTAKNITLAELLKEHAEYRRPDVRPSTQRAHADSIKRLVKIFPDGLLISAITLPVVQRSFLKMRDLSGVTVSMTASFFKQSMKYAKRMKYIEDISFIHEMTVSGRAKTVDDVKRAREKFLTREELAEVLQKVHEIKPRYALMLEFIALTGLRAGECSGLRYQDFDGQNIDINGTITHSVPFSAKEIKTPPKTLSSFRTVALNSRAIEILNQIRIENMKDAAWNKGKYTEKGYFFTSSTGNPIRFSDINHTLRSLKLPRHITTHVFRHTHIFLLAELGVPLKTIMERVGHINPKTTLAVYSHASEQMHRDAADKLDEISM
ncbi:integrase [Negativicoccus succinicivorans]|uniref:Integrase n=1 Tax=Negativicoccus succinicivorans TaxID=620903 RepID=A0A841QZE2_9FIRM|nr:site-specific integrase [Negativicoccus succinicivorans]MBB6478024.1 integrase [Negativicoccus succinicivorans]